MLYENEDAKPLIISNHGLLPILEILETCDIKSRQATILDLLNVVNIVSRAVSVVDFLANYSRSSMKMLSSKRTFASLAVFPSSQNLRA